MHNKSIKKENRERERQTIEGTPFNNRRRIKPLLKRATENANRTPFKLLLSNRNAHAERTPFNSFVLSET